MESIKNENENYAFQMSQSPLLQKITNTIKSTLIDHRSMSELVTVHSSSISPSSLPECKAGSSLTGTSDNLEGGLTEPFRR